MKTSPALPCGLLLGLLVASTHGALAAQQPPTTAVQPALAPYRLDLLRTAFDAASAFPLQPHGKNRSRAQEEVVVACFALAQPDLAVAFARDIADWRRGVAYADYAWHVAKRGDEAGARRYLDLAEQIVVAASKDENAQQWRADLVAIKMARAWRLLGDAERAATLVASVDATSANAVDASWAATEAERVDALPPAAIADELQAFDAGFARLTLGRQQATLVQLVRLYGRADLAAPLRAEVARRVEHTPIALPGAIHFDALAGLAEADLARGAAAAALPHIAAMRAELARLNLRAEDLLPVAARIAELTARAGDRATAQADLDAAKARFDRSHDDIVDIYRARALRPLALVAHALGDRARTIALLQQALDEGVANPNSRPRTDDLVATCVLMAKADIEPTPELWTRIRTIAGGMGEPW